MASSRRPRGSRKLRSALDRVLVHEVRNMGFRLRMLLSNLDEHYGDPEFKRSVQELLASTIERLDGIVGRWSHQDEALLIKVSVDINGILREIAAGTTRRGQRAEPGVCMALGEVPRIWGDPYFLRDALASLVENAVEAAPAGKVLVRSFAAGPRSRPRAVIEILDNGEGMSPDFIRDRLFRPFETTTPDGVGLGLFTASQIVRHHGGSFRVRSERGAGTVLRLSFPGATEPE